MLIKGLLLNIETKCVYFKSFDTEFAPSPDLLGSFLAAISIFAKNVTQDTVQEIILGKSKYFYSQIDEKSDINMVMIADEAAEDSKLVKTMKKLRESLLNRCKLEEIIENAINPKFLTECSAVMENHIENLNQVYADDLTSRLTDFELIEEATVQLEPHNFSFLFKNIKKDLGKVLYAIFIGMRVVVTGEREQVHQVIDALDLFSPKRNLSKIYWTDDPRNANADIVGIPAETVGLYVDSTILDLKNRTVEGINNNKYFEALVKKLEKSKPEKAASYITEKMEFLNAKRKEFMELSDKAEVTKHEVQHFSREIDKNLLKAFEAHFYWNYPRQAQKIKKTFETIHVQLLSRDFLIA